MKLIYPDLVSAASADFSAANFPVSNVEDEHPKRVWKSTGSSGKLSLSVSAGSNTATLFNTNADSVSVEARLGSAVEWEADVSWETGVSWNSSTVESVTFGLSPSGVGSLWVEYTAINAVHIVEFDLTNSDGADVYVGIARAGIRKEFSDPQHGIKESLVDYSIFEKLSNGATHYRKRDIVRSFSFRIMENRDPDFYTFMLNVAQMVGPEPIAWRLSTKVTDYEWVVFCRFDKMPDGDHFAPRYSYISINLIEVV